MSNTIQRVSYNDVVSDALPVSTEVPQGSILRPFLYLIFINDMPNVIKHGKISMYADDTTYVSDKDVNVISKKLTEDIRAITTWLRMNKLFLNIDKTK